MSFSRVNSLGWALYEVLTSTQMNSLDIDHANAIDGAAGGSYTPSSPVTFGTGKLEATPEAGDIVFQDEYVDHASYSTTRTFNFTGAVYAASRWTIGSWYAFSQTDVTTAGYVEMQISPSPIYGTITAAHVWIQGNGHSNLPATMPTFDLRCLPSTESSWSSGDFLGSGTDPSANVTEYDAFHTIDLTGLSYAIEPGDLLHLIVAGESGANAATGLKLVRATITTTCTRNYPA